MFQEAFRVSGGTATFSCSATRSDVRRKAEAERAGFKFWKPLVWDKRTIGMGYHYRARYELILFFRRAAR